jgi:NADH-quinone oxidoreductase subunit C
MDFEAITKALQARWPEITSPPVEAGDRFIIVPAEKAHEVLAFLKEGPEFQFDSLMCLSGADNGKELWVVYHLHSFKLAHRLTVKVVLPREKPECDSVLDLWGGSDFFEREAYDLYGISFRNHPDLRRLLNPPDWEGWPMRKDYKFPTEYRGIPTAREDQYFNEQVEAANKARQDKVNAKTW